MSKSALISIVLGLVALGGGWLAGHLLGPASTDQNATFNPVIPGGLVYPTPRELEPFSLLDHDGTAFTQDAFNNQWTVIFPGFTFCPDICPTTLATLNNVKTKLADNSTGDDVEVVFLSVDPARDTPERLKSYTTFYNPDFLGVTGDDDALTSFTTQLGMIYAVIKEDDNATDYLVDHSASLAVINPKGQLHAVFQPEHNAKTIASSIALLKERWNDKPDS